MRFFIKWNIYFLNYGLVLIVKFFEYENIVFDIVGLIVFLFF